MKKERFTRQEVTALLEKKCKMAYKKGFSEGSNRDEKPANNIIFEFKKEDGNPPKLSSY